MELIVNNVNEAFVIMWHRMHSGDMVSERLSRNGPVLVSDFPVTTIYKNPRERVLFLPERDANPFFHVFEAIWMLAGRNDLQFLQKFVSTFGDFSDNGLTLYGAYGHRWKRNGLLQIIKELSVDQTTRRAYLPIFEPEDVKYRGKDLPCNVGVLFQPDKNHPEGPTLNMTVFCRSNDMVLGAYGANVVHFSFLQEYVACLTGMRVGWYAQVSANFHIYPEFEVVKKLEGQVDPLVIDPYQNMAKWPIIDIVNQDRPIDVLDTTINKWQFDAVQFMDTYCNLTDLTMLDKYDAGGKPFNQFFREIARPMYRTWAAWKYLPKGKFGNYHRALQETSGIKSLDWQEAAYQWVMRRLARAGG